MAETSCIKVVAKDDGQQLHIRDLSLKIELNNYLAGKLYLNDTIRSQISQYSLLISRFRDGSGPPLCQLDRAYWRGGRDQPRAH
jgi:hypothetical protein